MARRLEEKTVLICGAGSVGEGIGNGKAMSVLFGRHGARVMAVDIDLNAAAETQRLVQEEGAQCEIFQADVSDSRQVKSMVDACLDRFGSIDVLVNNVGITPLGGPVELAEEDWDRTFAVNVKSMFLTCKYVIPVMEKAGGGSIVNISSIAALRWGGLPNAAYSASKAAVNGLTRNIAMQYAHRKIRVNAVLPGLINTPMIVQPYSAFYGHDLEKMMDTRNRMCPTGAMGDAWNVAHAALYLASDESSYVTGTELLVDGGLSCQVSTPSV